MQGPSWEVHVFRRLCKVEHLKPVGQPFGVRRNNPSLASRSEEPFDSSMTEASDHALSVAQHASELNYRSRKSSSGPPRRTVGHAVSTLAPPLLSPISRLC